jgi:hypothetical protein
LIDLPRPFVFCFAQFFLLLDSDKARTALFQGSSKGGNAGGNAWGKGGGGNSGGKGGNAFGDDNQQTQQQVQLNKEDQFLDQISQNLSYLKVLGTEIGEFGSVLFSPYLKAFGVLKYEVCFFVFFCCDWFRK